MTTSRLPMIDMSYYDFGVDLLDTYDLDPIYPMVAMTIQQDNIMKRWLLAYWCYYDAGVSSYIAEHASKHFYSLLSDGLATYPRGMERRHFRGEQAVQSIKSLQHFGPPEKVVDAMICHRTFGGISRAVQSFTGFGPWISWKAADMAERVAGYTVDFSNSNLGIYKDPRKGAAFILTGDKEYPISDEQVNEVVVQLLVDFHGHMAPPYRDRPVNVQEIETILCKYKAHCFGFYPMGNDSYHVTKALDGWGDLAQNMNTNLIRCCSYCRGDN